MPHSEQKCAHFCSECSIVSYGTGAFWDMWIRLIVSLALHWVSTMGGDIWLIIQISFNIDISLVSLRTGFNYLFQSCEIVQNVNKCLFVCIIISRLTLMWFLFSEGVPADMGPLLTTESQAMFTAVFPDMVKTYETDIEEMRSKEFQIWAVLTHLGLVSHICVVKNSSHFPSDAYMRRKFLYFSYSPRGRPRKQCQAKMS